MSIWRLFLFSAAGLATALAQQSTWFPEPGREKPGAGGPTCPPGAGRPFEKSAKDADIDGNGKIDRYMGEFRWDDKKGNDFRVEVWCIDDTYFSMRVYQSLNRKDTLVATPGGKDPETGATVTDPGHC